MTPLDVGVVGAGWMGHAHARSYLRVPHHYRDLGARPRLLAVADPVADLREDAVDRYGFETGLDNWQRLVDDPRIRVVSVTTPTFLHAEIGQAVGAAGKHLWIEKPVGLSLDETRRVRDAVAAAGVVGRVGFNYRHAPAVVKARALVRSGAIGTVTHARFRLLTDYAAHPGGVLSWRFESARGGDGVVGDLVSHGVDLVRYLVGEIAAVVAEGGVFIADRPLPSGSGSHYEVATGGPQGRVENLDHLSALMRTDSDVPVQLESSRVAVGNQNNYGFEIHGTQGSVAWDFRRMPELRISTGTEYQNQPVTDTTVGPGDGDYGRFQPGAGIAMGYDDLKVAECADLLSAVLGVPGSGLGATLDDAVAAAAVMAALNESVAKQAWTTVPPTAG
ncbi:MAG: Gfo/Idh/MocA family oxidoreductase [Nocardioidaceae bacterium]|nr:Gfo/Idh/MocA family oxidoreductase [Nocardioidaceae bacterium]NUS50185.1 Gfo/Idh/MocA family oxidoreductase [Nocardioidaceae bacterium]